MKKIALILSVVLCTLSVKAAERTKEFTKRYPAADYKEITILNRYGNIELRQGGEVFEVQAIIAIQGKNQAKVDELAEYIRVVADEDSRVLQIRTVFDKDILMSQLFSGISVDVDYRIRVPRGKQVRIVNRDGSIITGDYTGDLSVELESGNFVAKSVTEGVFSIKLTKGEFSVPRLDRLEGDFRTSTVKIGAGTDFKLDCGASVLHLMRADQVTIKSSGGNCFLGEVERLTVNSSYTKYETQHIGTSIAADCRGGEFYVRNIHTLFSQVAVKSSYTKVGLSFMAGGGFSLELRYNKGVKMDVSSHYALEKRPTTGNNFFETGFIGDEKFTGKVILNLSGGSLYML